MDPYEGFGDDYYIDLFGIAPPLLEHIFDGPPQQQLNAIADGTLFHQEHQEGVAQQQFNAIADFLFSDDNVVRNDDAVRQYQAHLNEEIGLGGQDGEPRPSKRLKGSALTYEEIQPYENMTLKDASLLLKDQDARGLQMQANVSRIANILDKCCPHKLSGQHINGRSSPYPCLESHLQADLRQLSTMDLIGHINKSYNFRRNLDLAGTLVWNERAVECEKLRGKYLQRYVLYRFPINVSGGIDRSAWKILDRETTGILRTEDPNLLSIKVNHGGGFSYVYGPKRTRALRRVYKGGNADWFDDVDADGFSVIEVSGMLKELGYDNPNNKIHYKKPTSNLDKGLEPLLKDIDVLDFLTYVKKFKLLKLFIEHLVDKCVIDESVIDVDGLDNDNVDLETDGIDNMEEELDPLFSYPNINHEKGQSSEHISSPLRDAEGSNDNENGYKNEDSDENENSDENEDSEESEDSDFKVPLEDKIDVDMEMFKENTDPSVEWVGSTEPHTQAEADNNDEDVYEECDLDDFDSDIDPNDVEAERKKALSKLRKCHKPVDGHIYTENFYVSQIFPNKEIIKDMVTRISVEKIRELHLVKNDQTRVRAECRGLVPVFGPTTNIDPNVETDGPSRSHGQSSGIDSLKKKTKKWGKLVVETLKSKRCRVDPNNGIYPLAYVYVESEIKQSWAMGFFLIAWRFT
ncbi:hypothetical protein Tco_1484543 [Tanacetum coccineum]